MTDVGNPTVYIGIMKINARIDVPQERIAEFCTKWQVVEFGFFGSVLRDDFGPDSDVDVLVRFEPTARWSLWDIPVMQEELEAIFGREVDIVDKDAIEASDNPFRKRLILGTSQSVYTRE